MKFFTNGLINSSAFFLKSVICLVVPVNSSGKYCRSHLQPCRFDHRALVRLTNPLFISSRCRSVKFMLGATTVIDSLSSFSFPSDHSPSTMHVCAFMIENVCCLLFQKITLKVPAHFNKSLFSTAFFL